MKNPGFTFNLALRNREPWAHVNRSSEPLRLPSLQKESYRTSSGRGSPSQNLSIVQGFQKFNSMEIEPGNGTYMCAIRSGQLHVPVCILESLRPVVNFQGPISIHRSTFFEICHCQIMSNLLLPDHTLRSPNVQLHHDSNGTYSDRCRNKDMCALSCACYEFGTTGIFTSIYTF